MSFKNLFIGFLVLITIAVASVLYNSRTIASNQQSIENITDHVYPYINTLNEFDMMITRSKMLITNWVYLPYSSEDKDELKALHESGYPTLKKELQALLADQVHQQDTGALRQLFTEFEQLLVIEQDIMMSLTELTDYEDDPAIMFEAEELIELEVLERTPQLQSSLAAIIQTNRSKAQAQKLEMQASLTQLEQVVWGVGIAIILIIIFSYLYIHAQITRPVLKMRNTLLSLADGKPLEVLKSKESTVIGKMNNALAKLANTSKHTATFAQHIGEGNYEADYQLLSEDDLMGTSLMNMRDRLKDYAHNMEEKVATRTKQLEEKQNELTLKNAALISSEEEIRQNAEELQTVNENLSSANGLLESQQKELQKKNDELKASEEEIRQNSEELQAVNEHLNETKSELEKAFTNEKESKAKLEQAFIDLKETQSQLVQAEKMSSLGQLTAGVAHEINNPINFVYAGANTLQNVIDEMCQIVNQYDKVSIDDTYEIMKEKLTSIQNLKAELYFEDMEEDLKGLVKDIILGADRTQKIVQSLKTFSRLDEEDRKKADIEENIEATLTILNSQFDNRIVIVKSFEEKLPMIDCHIGQINQVFMNLITNACQAIEGKGTVSLKLWAERDKNAYYIEIGDSGTGMSQETLDQIFNPFFTTKDVGEGTGLGLSITHGIIEKHGGHITASSELGKGSTFTIQLPIEK